MKKLLCLIMALTLIISAIPTFALDLTDNAQDELKEFRIMQGDPDGNLRLGDNITRNECAKIISVALGYDTTPVNATLPFDDVDKNHWAYDYILFAYSSGIINGDDNGKFNPDNNITNEEMVKMVVSMLGYSPMADMQGGYPMGYNATATRIEVTTDLKLVTNKPATRNDVAIMIHRALDVPLMLQNGFGADISYVIMDGKNGIEYITLRTNSFPKSVATPVATPTPAPDTDNEKIPSDIPYYNGAEYTSKLIKVENLQNVNGTYIFTNSFDTEDVNAYVIDKNTYVCDYADYMLPLKDIEEGKFVQCWYKADEKNSVHLLKVQIMKNAPDGI